MVKFLQGIKKRMMLSHHPLSVYALQASGIAQRFNAAIT